MSATDAPFSGEENRLREGMAETTHRVGRAGASGCPVPPGAPWPRRRHQWTLRLGALGASPRPGLLSPQTGWAPCSSSPNVPSPGICLAPLLARSSPGPFLLSPQASVWGHLPQEPPGPARPEASVGSPTGRHPVFDPTCLH